jgi:hypothetical protein
MASFHHLGYFPFCIARESLPASRSIEMPLADAMKLFWSVKQCRFRLGFSYNAHLSQGAGTSPTNFVRANCAIDETKTIFNASGFADRVCLNQGVTVSGGAIDTNGEGSTQYFLRLFADSGFLGGSIFPRVSSTLGGSIPPDAVVRVSTIFRVSNSGYYSTVSWNQGTTLPFEMDGSAVIPLQLTIGSSAYTLNTAVGYIGYPHVDQGGPLPSASYSVLQADFII